LLGFAALTPTFDADYDARDPVIHDPWGRRLG